MSLKSRTFQLAKDPEHPEQCEDAFGLDAARGVAVVADGVSSAIFSRRWAGILCEAVLDDPPEPNDPETFAPWLAERRERWAREIDTGGLAWFQKAKLPLGAFSTLLWVQVAPEENPPPGQFGAYRLLCHTIGDSCLFHFRGGELVRSFPVEHSSQLQADPIVLGSVDLKRDRLMKFATLDKPCYDDDLLVLCTDAVADWVLRQMESGSMPDWDRWWNLDERCWEEEIVAMRTQRKMRYDDATLVLLRIQPQAAEVTEPQPPPPVAEPIVAEPIVAEAVEAVPPTLSEAKPSGKSPNEPPNEPSSEPSPRRSPSDSEQEEDWQEKFRTAGEQMAEGIDIASRQIFRGLKKWKEKAVEKYHEKFDQDDE